MKLNHGSPILPQREIYDDWLDEPMPKYTVKQAATCFTVIVGLSFLMTLWILRM